MVKWFPDMFDLAAPGVAVWELPGSCGRMCWSSGAGANIGLLRAGLGWAGWSLPEPGGRTLPGLCLQPPSVLWPRSSEEASIEDSYTRTPRDTPPRTTLHANTRARVIHLSLQCHIVRRKIELMVNLCITWGDNFPSAYEILVKS